MLKKIIKKILPEFILYFFTGMFYGWRGNYSSWSKALQKCTGYNSPEILEKVKTSALKAKNKEVAYERDSMTFHKIEYSFPSLTALMWIAAQNGGSLNVLDFGGSLGSTYFQHRTFFDKLTDSKWCIVEQENFVKTGLEHFSDKNLKFYYSIDDCLNENKIDIIHLSSVLQYIEKPYELLDYIISKNIKYLLIDRTPFIKGNDRITIQKVKPLYYKASYPCWFFNQDKFVRTFENAYSLIYDFEALDKANIPSVFKGFLFQKK